jgi:hypothetical protein
MKIFDDRILLIRLPLPLIQIHIKEAVDRDQSTLQVENIRPEYNLLYCSPEFQLYVSIKDNK